MPLKLLPMQPSNCETWMRIRAAAYVGPTNQLVHTRPLSEESLLKVAEDRAKNFHAPGTFHYKVIDTDAQDEMIACAQWTLHNFEAPKEASAPEEKQVGATAKADGVDDALPRDPRWKSDGKKEGDGMPFLPPEVNLAVLSALLTPLREACAEIMGAARPYLMLNTLATKPGQERRGAGGMLVQWGVDKADRLGLECYLDTSKVGRRLYERMGFVLVREVWFDREKWGGEGIDWHGCMIRRTKTQEEEMGAVIAEKME